MRWPGATSLGSGRVARQSSVATAQRGAKAQPSARRERSGGCPAMVRKRANPLGRGAGSNRAGRGYRDALGGRRRRAVRPSSTMRPAYITASRSAGFGDDAHVVRDENQRHARSRAEGRGAGPGSGPGSSRRAPWSARRRRAASARRPWPWRSRRVAACRPTTGGDIRRPRRCRGNADAVEQARARPRARHVWPNPRCSRSGSAIWMTIGWTGSRLVIGFWKTMAMSRPRTRRRAFSSRARRSRPGKARRVAVMSRGRGRQEAHDARQSTDFPLPELANDAEGLAWATRARPSHWQARSGTSVTKVTVRPSISRRGAGAANASWDQTKVRCRSPKRRARPSPIRLSAVPVIDDGEARAWSRSTTPGA